MAGPSLDAKGAHGVFCIEPGLLLAGKVLAHNSRRTRELFNATIFTF